MGGGGRWGSAARIGRRIGARHRADRLGVRGGGSGSGSPGQANCRMSRLRRRRSFSTRGPVIGSNVVVPVRNGDSRASCPGTRGNTIRKGVLVSCDEWQPLQVLSANLCRASGLVIPGANHELRSLNTAPVRNGRGMPPSRMVSGMSCRSSRMLSSLALTKSSRT